jgi:Mg-chelatase subunit ChlD
VRRYNSGDAFRDISVRHTLKEVARQRKELTDVRRSDFRVFMKQRRKQQSDIVLCLDTSGSMGFHHKLMFARLAAIGIAKAAVENGDRVGVVAFDNATQTILPITAKDKESIVDYISQLFARGNTNIGDGIRCATDLLSQGKSQNQKYIVLVTDGQPTAISQQTFERLKVQSEKDLTEESAVMETRKAAARGIKLSVVHVANRNEPSGEFIRSLARAGRGKVRRMSGLEDLGTIMHG